VSIIVVGFAIAVFAWMLLLLIAACVYRHALEKYINPDEFYARKEM
jgi:hypothetical protein